jgi:hypothetical protein
MDEVQDEAGPSGLAYARAASQDPDERLTIGNVAVLSVRLLAVYCLLQSVPLLYLLPTLVLMLPRVSSAEDMVAYAATGLAPMIYLAVGVTLLAKSRRVALRLVGASPDRDVEGSVRIRATGRALQSLAFAVVGVVVFIDGATEFVHVVATGYRSSEVSGHDLPTSVLKENLAGLLSAVITAGAGALLFFGSQRLSRFWHRTRMTEPQTGRTGPSDASGAATGVRDSV